MSKYVQSLTVTPKLDFSIENVESQKQYNIDKNLYICQIDEQNTLQMQDSELQEYTKYGHDRI